MPSKEVYASPQASGPEQFQLHLVARIATKLAEAKAVCAKQTYIPGGVAGLIDDAGAYFGELLDTVSLPRPTLLNSSLSVSEIQERQEPLPRWIPDRRPT